MHWYNEVNIVVDLLHPWSEICPWLNKEIMLGLSSQNRSSCEQFGFSQSSNASSDYLVRTQRRKTPGEKWKKKIKMNGESIIKVFVIHKLGAYLIIFFILLFSIGFFYFCLFLNDIVERFEESSWRTKD